MSAPERIWIDGAINANVWAEQKTDCTLSGVAAYEYVRADLCAKSEAISPMQDERLRAVAEAAKHVRALDEDEFEVIVGNCAYYNLNAALRALEQGEG